MKRLILTLIISLMLVITASAQTGGTTLDNVNLRASAGFGNNILTQIPIDAAVTINGRNSDGAWLQVTYNGATGWVSSRYINWDDVDLLNFPVVGGSFDAPAQPSVTVSDSAFAVQTTTRLNIRTEPRVLADLITTLPSGQSGVAVGRSRDGAWVAIDTGAVQGWVSGAYLSSDVDLMGLPVTSDYFGAPVAVLPEEPPVADIIISDNGEFVFTGPAVGNSTSYDVEITLHWNSTANLDLRVTGPDGFEISPGTQSPTGGYFQQPVGANETCVGADGAPLEVITWRLGTAPSGLYSIRAIHANSCNTAAEEDTLFWVRVNNDGPEAFFYVDYISPGEVFDFSFVRP